MPRRPVRKHELPPCPPELTGPTVAVALSTELGTLVRGDCLDVLAGLADESVRLVVADPPYAISKAAWDEFESMDAYTSWCDTWLAEVHRVLVPEGTAYVCGFSEILAEVKVRSARRFAGGCRWLVWYYRNKANLGSDWGRSHESILHLRKGRKPVMNVDAVRVPYNDHTRRYPGRVQAVSSQFAASGRRDAWQPHPLGAKPRDVLEIPVICNGMSEKTAHPTQKPVELVRRMVEASSLPGDLVVDPFAGSGTTALVAQQAGRRWLAGDADGRYVAVARGRLREVSQTPRRSS